MSVLFISHSSLNNDEAITVHDWLKAQGYGEIFLDLDAQAGLAPGERWQSELKRAGERCSAVIVLLSPEWVASAWCRTEFLVAVQLGKRIFPVMVKPTPFEDLPRELVSHFQMADISTPEVRPNGFERLAIGLKRAGLDPSSFPWPPADEPARNPYRGLAALDVQDAAVFFGRDIAITGALDLLRRMRADSTPQLAVILGSSGAGKSSFLRAGLLARLINDTENFIALPVLRPGNAALSGPTGLQNVLGRPVQSIADVLAVFDERRTAIVERLERYADASGQTASNHAPSIVLALDQAEEFYTAENTEGETTLDLIAGALVEDGNAFAVATIRSDNYTAMQTDPRLAGLTRTLFNLGPMSHVNFKDVIEGPAQYAVPPVSVEPELTEKLLDDLDQDDALPLLGFTLERLLRLEPASARMTLRGYQDNLGGLSGAIRRAVDQAFAAARNDPELPGTLPELYDLARAAFIPWLVSLEAADAEPRRRVASVDDIPVTARPLVRHLVDHRLLVSTTQLVGADATTTYEVAHEAILRRWTELAGWIDAERDFLVGKSRLDQMLADWTLLAGDDRDKGLVGGVLLDRARDWLIEHPGRFGDEERMFIRRSDDAARAESARRRLLQRSVTWGSMVAAIVFAVVGLFAIDAREDAENALKTATAAADRMVYDIVQEYRDSDAPPPVFRAILEEARNLLAALSKNHPDDTPLKRSQVIVQNELGNLHLEQGNLEKAELALEKSLIFMQTLGTKTRISDKLEESVTITKTVIATVREVRGQDAETPGDDDAIARNTPPVRRVMAADKDPQTAIVRDAVTWVEERTVAIQKVSR